MEPAHMHASSPTHAPRPTPFGQRGATLIISLVLVSVMSLVGISALSGANMQERMASNTRQQAEAFLAAEAGAAAAATWLLDNDDDWGDVGAISLPAFDNPNASYAVTIAFDTPAADQATITSIGTTNGGARRTITAVFDRATEGDSIVPPFAEAAFSCFGGNCSIEVGGSSTVRGTDWHVPANFNCAGAGCNGTLSDRDPVTGIYMAEGGDIDLGPGQQKAYGDPPTRITDEYTGDYGSEYWNGFISELTGITPPTEFVGSVSTGDIGTRETPTFSVLKEGAQVSGNVSGAGILIVEPGVSFTGTMHYEGLIIVLPGANFSAGNVRLFGAVVALSDDENPVDWDQTGNMDIKYSSEALENLGPIGETPGEPGRLTLWREVSA
jgi:type II secretory pathway pseudopilin PulG